MHQSCADPGAVRGRVAAAEAYPPGYADRPGQRLPRRFSAASWAFSIPGWLALFSKVVPDEFWAVTAYDVERQEPAIATIACVCGEEPEVAQMGTTICHGAKCGRAFILLHDRVRAARLEDPNPVSPST